MRALAVKALGDLGRRKLQTAVVLVVVMIASCTATIALTLAAEANNPFNQAFAAQEGAHLQVTFDASQVSPDQLASTSSVVGASATGGPWPSTVVTLEHGTEKFAASLVARDRPDGPVDRIRVVDGRWVNGPGEIVLDRSQAERNGVRLGDAVSDVSLLNPPVLRIVGLVVDIDQGFGWVASGEVPRLFSSEGRSYDMAYRLPGTPDDATLTRGLDRLKASLPPDAVTDSLTYLELRSVTGLTSTVIMVVLIAFSLLALAASLAIVVNLVAGVVIDAYRDVGVMKAIGYTPSQVVVVFVLQMLLPAAVGSLVGIAAGTLVSLPLLAQSAEVLGLAPEPAWSPAYDSVVLTTTLAAVALAATLPALRAGRLSAIRAIVVGSAPAPRGGIWLRRMLGRHVPIPVALGIGLAFARPSRAGLAVLAILIGVATVVFALVSSTFGQRVEMGITHADTAQLQITREDGLLDSSLMPTLAAQSQTVRVVGQGQTQVSVPGLATPIAVIGLRGNSGALGFTVVKGRWFEGPGEAVAGKSLLEQAHVQVGGILMISTHGQLTPVTVVGEVYDVQYLGQGLYLDWPTFEQLGPTTGPHTYWVTLKPGSDELAYGRQVAAGRTDFITVRSTRSLAISQIAIIDSVEVALAAVLSLIAAAGVFSTLLLSTKESARDTALLKAVGMTPIQVIAMVTSSAMALAILGGTLGLPVGVLIAQTLDVAFAAATGNDPPASANGLTTLMLLTVFGGALVVAVLAAGLPGWRSARTPVNQLLHAE